MKQKTTHTFSTVYSIVIFVTLIAIFLSAPPLFGQFTEVGAALGLNVGGDKDGGVAWGDFNNDGCLDLAVNTNQIAAGFRSRLFMGSCGGGFTDVTNSHATGLLQVKCERSVVWADLNNDGNIDLARNTHNRFEVYLNQGPGGNPAYSFGNANHQPDFVITNIAGGMNTEGFGWIDTNGDGWLDLVCENHNFGIDIFQNPANGTANFIHVTPNGSTLGLPTGGTTGDYMALTDYNNDGNIDIFARKENEMDLWTNQGVGAPGNQFIPNATINLQARNSNKGGVLFADFDNDGDFDLIWTDHPSVQIWQNLGFNSGNFQVTNQPAQAIWGGTIPAGVNIDGCAVADVNHDGRIDLFLSDQAGASFLLINTTAGPGNFSFSHENRNINVNGDGEGMAFGDYDNDGDMDLYINRKNAGNQLWRNNLNNNDYLKVRVMRDLGAGLMRADVGATIVLKDCNGNVLSGIREVNGTRGHGSQDYAEVHFGLPNGPNAVYVIEVGFTRVNGTRRVLQQALIPSLHLNHTVTVTQNDPDDLSLCSPILPVELIAFEGQAAPEGNLLKWEVAGVGDGMTFLLEKQTFSDDFLEIGRIEQEEGKNVYQQMDGEAESMGTVYRLSSLDAEGQITQLGVLALSGNSMGGDKLYPTVLKAGDVFWLETVHPQSGILEGELWSMDGKLVKSWSKAPEALVGGKLEFEIPPKVPAGIYLLRLHEGSWIMQKRVFVR